MFKFVPDNVGGVGTKRKHSHKSCSSCKRRHKRCSHGDVATRDHSQSAPAASPRLSLDTQGQFGRPNDARSSAVSAQLSAEKGPPLPRPRPGDYRMNGQVTTTWSDDAYLRFVGDLSPEASFLTAGPKDNGASSTSRHADVGVWLGQRSEEHPQQPASSSARATEIAAPSQPLGLTCLEQLTSRLRAECLAVLPPPYELKVISELYFKKTDPIFPVLHGEIIQDHNSMESIALKQCICLQAALDPSLKEHLRLPHTERILSPIDFRSCIARAVKQSLDMGFIRDKVVLLQVCALMAFYVNRPSCSEVSTYYSAQAVHHSQTLGLHLGWPDDSAKAEKSRRISWCVWVLDRLNAATNGRPVLIHSRDMDERIMESVTEQIPSFRLLIRISKFLDEVISQYRPRSASESQRNVLEIPSFEDLVCETNAADISDTLLAIVSTVVRQVIPEHEARSYKEEIEAYIAANPSTKAFPPNDPQVFEIYWSRPQLAARSHKNMLRTQSFLMSYYHSQNPHAECSTDQPLTYADRLRIRQPGDVGFALGPHVDGGSVERWEENGYGKGHVYDKIFEGKWEQFDPWELSTRLTADADLYNGAGACTMFRMFQGWFSMSHTGPKEGTLLVNPLLSLSTSYFLLRPFFTPKSAPILALGETYPSDYLSPSNWKLEDDPVSSALHGAWPGHGQELNHVLHPHLDLPNTMVHVPRIAPGDYVAWHCDTIHAVDSVHTGTGDSSVMYIPACPTTRVNIDYAKHQREHFLEGIPPSDFPGGIGESQHVGRPGPDTLKSKASKEGLRAAGFARFDIGKADGAGETQILKYGNKVLGL